MEEVVMSHGGVTEGSACLPADDYSAARLMSELSPRLQPLTTSFDNSLRRQTSRKLPGTLAPPLRGVHGNREQAERTVIQLIPQTLRAASPPPFNPRLISVSICPPLSPSAALNHSSLHLC